ncbi:hypothetical protein [Rhizobium mongolense]|uniref:Uncharacterized protein n=2 Tax=Rhizobium mongolense TaxID=57676 RepID=A0ABR6IP14_9HYPH|nr:hypothetical protein [Rhizobium mongolense]MBB4229626.1 hypothetical protein [Rhizobium mongolense]TVZ73212.1 hypothetical protein BCL32_1426 [Rhizobium mongolense USDA 1844]
MGREFDVVGLFDGRREQRNLRNPSTFLFYRLKPERNTVDTSDAFRLFGGRICPSTLDIAGFIPARVLHFTLRA